MKVLKIVVPFVMVSWTNVCAQQLSHQVMVPLAGVVNDGKISYSQTVGETATEIVGCYDYIFTQGFQQPGIRFSNAEWPKGTGVKVYPNPADDHLTVELFGESARNIIVQITDITGTVIIADRKSFSDKYWYKEEYNIDYLIRGFYLVRVLAEDGLLNRTIKIEKI